MDYPRGTLRDTAQENIVLKYHLIQTRTDGDCRQTYNHIQ